MLKYMPLARPLAYPLNKKILKQARSPMSSNLAMSEVRATLPRFAKLLILLGIILIAVRLCLWHVVLDKTVKGDQKFLDGREAVTGMHCANDRSRWATVAALVHNGTFSIDDIDPLRGKNGNWVRSTRSTIRTQRGWNDTIPVNHHSTIWSSRPNIGC